MPEFLFLKQFPRYVFDMSQAARKNGIDGTGRKARGGPGSRVVERSRASDSEEEDRGERPPGHKLAKKLQKQEEERQIVKARNEAAIAFEQENYTKRAALYRQSIQCDNGRAAADRYVAEVN